VKTGPAASSAGDAAAVKQAKAAKAAGNYDQALQALGTATSADACWIRAWILAERGQKPQAAAEFGKFVAAAKPNDARVAQAKAALQRLAAGAGLAGGAPGGLPPGPPGGSKAVGPK
jgi:hypothetical protein